MPLSMFYVYVCIYTKYEYMYLHVIVYVQA